MPIRRSRRSSALRPPGSPAMKGVYRASRPMRNSQDAVLQHGGQAFAYAAKKIIEIGPLLRRKPCEQVFVKLQPPRQGRPVLFPAVLGQGHDRDPAIGRTLAPRQQLLALERAHGPADLAGIYPCQL